MTGPTDQIIARWGGFCPICFRRHSSPLEPDGSETTFFVSFCGSIPRERAVMLVIQQLLPHWAQLSIHESSPLSRGVSALLARQASRYIATQFWPDITVGSSHMGMRCENLEDQTFPSESFDLVITQDVMEHLFHPEKAYQEIYRTLRSGGYHIHTTPIYKVLQQTEQKATLGQDGHVRHLAEPEYHGNPISGDGSLVTFHYGHDLPDLITEWTLFDVEVRRFADRTHGIVAEFTEVIVCKKPR